MVFFIWKKIFSFFLIGKFHFEKSHFFHLQSDQLVIINFDERINSTIIRLIYWLIENDYFSCCCCCCIISVFGLFLFFRSSLSLFQQNIIRIYCWPNEFWFKGKNKKKKKNSIRIWSVGRLVGWLVCVFWSMIGFIRYTPRNI